MRERQSIRQQEITEPNVVTRASPEKPVNEEANLQSALAESRRLPDNITSSKKDHLTFSASMPMKNSDDK